MTSSTSSPSSPPSFYDRTFVVDSRKYRNMKIVLLTPNFKEKLGIYTAALDENEGAVYVQTATNDENKSIYMELGNFSATENEQRFIDEAVRKGYPTHPATDLATFMRNTVFEPYEAEQTSDLNSSDEEEEEILRLNEE
jgi:hypothetical protein